MSDSTDSKAKASPDNVTEGLHVTNEGIAVSDPTLMEKINEQTREIEDAVKKEQALVGEKEPIDVLLTVYNEHESAEYYKKSLQLAKVYKFYRRIRGDGCCFYRALLCAQLESLLNDSIELSRLVLYISLFRKFSEICKNWRQRLLKLGFPEFTTNDFCDWFDELLDDIAVKSYDENSLMLALNEEGRSNYYVTFLRLITSGFLRENASTYEGFIEGGCSVEEFCQSEIEPMYKDCDHLAIIALTNALGVSIRIEYMDRTAAPNHGWYYDFIVQQNPIRHRFLYRPGHYDIIYET
ncbi:unnamed protein product [Thelazia callipaeda]|uniref:Ubiquitin thioesterase n=1 Tax=Thelazia callipaeda TaxID=103827 RepID=A0A0N5CUI6_THECL|nr:unnamed protein product [Thelazia callipaeda]